MVRNNLKNSVMEDFIFENNANEEFKLFFDEEYNRYCLNIRIDDELKACFILDDEDIDSLGAWYKNIEEYRKGYYGK